MSQLILFKVLSGLGVWGLMEGLIWCGKRFSTRFQGSALFHLWALSLGVFQGFVGTPFAVQESGEETVFWTTICVVISTLTALVLFHLLDLYVLQRPWDTKRGPMVHGLSRTLLRWVAGALGMLGAVYTLHGTDLPSVLVSSTVLSAVLGLALQDVLKNVFAGVSIQSEGLVRVGDWVRFRGGPAVVVEISWRSTRLRTNEGIEMLIPNAELSNQELVIYGSGKRPVGFVFEVGLPYETPPDLAKSTLLEAARTSPGAAPQPAPQAFLLEYGDSSILYGLRVWTREVSRVAIFRDAVNSRIWYQVQRAGLYIPFPIRTVQLHEMGQGQSGEEATLGRTVALLQRVPLFAELEARPCQHLAQGARKLVFGPGEVLVREGEPGDSLYVVDRGRVRITARGESEGEGPVELGVIEDGQFFGEASLLTGEPRSATATAETGCEVVVLPRSGLAPVLEAQPRLAETLSEALAERRRATASALEQHHGDSASGEMPQAEASTILGRIRELFRLG